MLEEYDSRMSAARNRVRSHSGVAAILDPELAPQVLHRFLIWYCALGVRMTAPVDGWIRRAGIRCREVGLLNIGDSLVKHAVHEAGHDRMFVDDAHSLARAYEQRYGQRIDAAALLQWEPVNAVRRYISLHERTIDGATPYGQVAIELEIESLSTTLGPVLIDHFSRTLGGDILRCLTFLQEHVALDVGHTALNRKMLGRLLEVKPDALELLVQIGAEALETYLDFMGECFGLARGTALPIAA